jgi:flagellar protein FlaF
MGFSVSGSAAIIFVTLFVTFGMYHSAAADSFERVTDARGAQTDAALETRNTALAVESATYNATDGTLTVVAENTGAGQLSLGGTDLLIDGRYASGWQSGATVAGAGDTRLWLAGERLTITVSPGAEPDRVKLVGGHGVADTQSVVVVS